MQQKFEHLCLLITAKLSKPLISSINFVGNCTKNVNNNFYENFKGKHCLIPKNLVGEKIVIPSITSTS